MNRSSHKHHILSQWGQGLAEYAIILAFVGVSALLTITILDPSLSDVFSRITRSDPVSPPSLVDYAAQPTPTASNPTATPTGPTPTATNTAAPTATMTATAAPSIGCGSTLEAETAALSGAMVINAGLDPAASGGKYIHVPDGTGDNLIGPGGDSATFNFDIATADTYRFIGYVYAEDDTSNSFFVEIDGTRMDWDAEIYTFYDPDYINKTNGTPIDPVELSLSAGSHTIVVSLREDGTRLDKIVFECTSAPLNPTPTPEVDNCSQTFEAEAATLSGLMVIGNDGSASGGQYVHVPTGDNFTGPNNDSVTFNVTVTEDRDYQLIGYSHAATGSNNSFWVSLNGSDALWDVEENSTYDPDYVNDRNGSDPVIYNLTAGSYTIVVSLREPDTRLDKLTLECATPDPNDDFLLPADNLCPGAITSQSSTINGGISDRACDGDRTGTYLGNSVTHTDSDNEAWWQVDLGRIYVLQQIKIFNRTDCCSDRLSNFYIFVSDNPFTSTDLTTTINQPGVDSYYFDGNVESLAYAFSLQSGRYIRIQLTGSDPLSLAEVEIYGSLEVPDSCSAVLDMFYIIDRSGSMTFAITGATDRMEASRNAITAVNDAMIASGLPHRVGAVTFAGNGSYNAGGFDRINVDNVSYAVTTDIADFNLNILPNINPGGYTPTGPALFDTRLAMVDEWDPLRIPIIILITDGAPNVPQDEILHSASEAAMIDVYDINGDPHPLSTLATLGPAVQGSSLNQGNILVDVITSAEVLMDSLPNATLYTVGLGDVGATEFNPSLLTRVAEIGGGTYSAVSSASGLTTVLTDIYNSVPPCDVDS